MTWYFCFYFNSKTVHTKLSNSQCIDISEFNKSYPSTIIHMDESHFIHMLGDKVKNVGMGSSIIFETFDDNEAVMLSLMKNEIMVSNNNKVPILQFILLDPDFNELQDTVNPLILIKKEQIANRINEQLENAIRRTMVHHQAIISDYSTMVSSDFTEATSVFTTKCNEELDKIQSERQKISSKAKLIRRSIVKKMISYTTFILIPGLK